uniref:Uncharacterized protein n=1 Tax=Plectus sambesii TaxID=2011161 RepID=A0A914V4C0_9BILA
MLTRETLVMVIKNKTYQWLDKLSPSARLAQLTAAKERAPALRSLYLQRKSALIEERKSKLLEAKEDTTRRQMQAVRTLSTLTTQMAVYGLWTNEIELDLGLTPLSDSEKFKALNAQLRFRRIVLKQPGDRTLFSLSAKGKKHSLELLRQNLLELMVAAQRMPPSPDPYKIIHKRINHRFQKDGVEKWYPGIVSRTVPGTGEQGAVVYQIVYDTDTKKEYPLTLDNLAFDLENGDFVVI